MFNCFHETKEIQVSDNSMSVEWRFFLEILIFEKKITKLL